MGKITGFMEFERIEEGYKPVTERLKNYGEFVIGLTEERNGAPSYKRHGSIFSLNGAPERCHK